MHPLRQFVLFAGVGAVGTAAQYLVLVLLVEGLALNPVLASTLGFGVGAVVNYLLNYHYTFRSDKSHFEAAGKFFSVALLGAISNSLLMYLAIDCLGLNYLLAQILATGVVLGQNFLLNRHWTFAAPLNSDAES